MIMDRERILYEGILVGLAGAAKGRPAAARREVRELTPHDS
jgi:hypothetical protein